LVEDQLARLLATFNLPDEIVADEVRLYNRANDQRDDADRRRWEITGRIERITELYKWGDLTRETYRAEREQLEAELARLRVTTGQAEVLVQAAAFLKDLPGVWQNATPEQRNALAQRVVASIEIADDRVVAVVPQPDFAPFFVRRAIKEGLLSDNDNSAAEATLSTEVMNGRKRRGSLARDRRGRAASHSLAVSRTSASLTTTLRSWPVRGSRQWTPDRQRAVA
jgi:hypothetical protein